MEEGTKDDSPGPEENKEDGMLVYPGKLGPGGQSVLVCVTRGLSLATELVEEELVLGACRLGTGSSASCGGWWHGRGGCSSGQDL